MINDSVPGNGNTAGLDKPYRPMCSRSFLAPHGAGPRETGKRQLVFRLFRERRYV